mgnify:CR=1 FL=1
MTPEYSPHDCYCFQRIADAPPSAFSRGGGSLVGMLQVRIAELERQIAEHRCVLPASIQEALNSGDGTYRP